MDFQVREMWVSGDGPSQNPSEVLTLNVELDGGLARPGKISTWWRQFLQIRRTDSIWLNFVGQWGLKSGILVFCSRQSSFSRWYVKDTVYKILMYLVNRIKSDMRYRYQWQWTSSNARVDMHRIFADHPCKIIDTLTSTIQNLAK